MMLNSLLEELQKADQDAKKLAITTQNSVEDFYSDLSRTVEQVKEGVCIKNPTQSQVLKMKRNSALSLLN
jgi:chloramphenicol O-acetyltransferase